MGWRQGRVAGSGGIGVVVVMVFVVVVIATAGVAEADPIAAGLPLQSTNKSAPYGKCCGTNSFRSPFATLNAMRRSP